MQMPGAEMAGSLVMQGQFPTGLFHGPDFPREN
jgi:hypothetical protein